jgi:hypothetical protein
VFLLNCLVGRQVAFLPLSSKPTHRASPSESLPDFQRGANGFQAHPEHRPSHLGALLRACYHDPEPKIRLQRIAEAQTLILRRAEALEEGKATDAECQALEDAAEFLQGLKLASTGDGVGKQVEVGDLEPLPETAKKPDDPILKGHRLT